MGLEKVCLNRFLGYYYLETMAMEFLQVFKVIHKLKVTKLGKNEELELLVLKFESSVCQFFRVFLEGQSKLECLANLRATKSTVELCNRSVCGQWFHYPFDMEGGSTKYPPIWSMTLFKHDPMDR